MLSKSDVERIDRLGQWRVYEDWPEHCKRAADLEVSVPNVKDVDRIIVAGMGGSGVVGDVLQDWLSPTSTTPVEVLKDYNLPRYVCGRTLVMALSLSGDTEETLSAATIALKMGAKIVAISSGGMLQRFAMKNRIPHTKVEKLLLPRASFPYLLYAAANVLQGIGVIDRKDDLVSSVQAVTKVSKIISLNNRRESNPAKKLASWLVKGLPIIYSSTSNRSVGSRFKSCLNENAKLHALYEILPELCHNGIVGWEAPINLVGRPVMIRHSRESPELKTRFGVVKEVIERSGSEIYEFNLHVNGHLATLISSIYALDYASIYAAVLRGIDPSPTPSIDHLKQSLLTKMEPIAKRFNLP